MAYLKKSKGTIKENTMDSPVLTTPALGTPSAGVMTNMTGAVTASLVDDAVTLAKMASGTDGNIISYDASGNPAAVVTGSSGQVLTSAGAGAPPTMAAAGGGKVLQAVTTNVLGVPQYSVNSDTFATVGLAVSITPASSSNKILILASISCSTDDGGGGSVVYSSIFRDNTLLQGMTAGIDQGITHNPASTHLSYLDSPSSTSSISYNVRAKGGASAVDFRMNDLSSETSSHITALEIAG